MSEEIEIRFQWTPAMHQRFCAVLRGGRGQTLFRFAVYLALVFAALFGWRQLGSLLNPYAGERADDWIGGYLTAELIVLAAVWIVLLYSLATWRRSFANTHLTNEITTITIGPSGIDYRRDSSSEHYDWNVIRRIKPVRGGIAFWLGGRLVTGFPVEGMDGGISKEEALRRIEIWREAAP